MGSSVQTDLEEQSTSKLSTQALSFFLHSLLALASWMALMLLGYAINPSGVPQLVILLLSAAVPLAVGFLVARIYPAEMATLVWLLGIIWFLIVCLWVLNMPTGPNQCLQCEATEKLTRTFYSLPSPSGHIDNDGPFIGTWPAVALVGYSMGAKLGFRRPK
jgi:energy-coupling factor transporter transmembrane protein EcfT